MRAEVEVEAEGGRRKAEGGTGHRARGAGQDKETEGLRDSGTKRLRDS